MLHLCIMLCLCVVTKWHLPMVVVGLWLCYPFQVAGKRASPSTGQSLAVHLPLMKFLWLSALDLTGRSDWLLGYHTDGAWMSDG